jgi:hypothetical protein
MKPDPIAPEGNHVLETINSTIWSALRFLMIALLVLLLVNTAAILALNFIYGTEALRHRYHWQGTLLRNAFFGLFFVCIYFFARSGAPISKGPTEDRFSSVKTKLLRAFAWLALMGMAVIETITLAGNLLFYQTATLVRTPSQTLNLIYTGFFGCIGAILLSRTRSSGARQELLPSQLRSLLTGVLWHGFKRSIACSFLFAVIFALGAFIVYKTAIEGRDPPPHFIMLPFPFFFAIYILAGLLCGAHVGAISAIRGKTDELVRGCYSLAEPLLSSLLGHVRVEETGNLGSLYEMIDRAKLTGATGLGVAARLMQRTYLHSIRGSWIVDLIGQWRQQHTTGFTKEPLENVLREKIIQVTAGEVKGRLALFEWATYALAAALLSSPFLLLLMAR